MEKLVRSMFRAASLPLMWAFAFIITASEVPSAFLPFPVASSLASVSHLPCEVVSELCAVVVYGAVIAVAPRIGALSRQGWLFAAAPVLGFLGLLICCLPGQSGMNPLTVFAGIMSIQVSFSLLFLICLELLAEAPALEVRYVIVGSALVNAFAMGIAEATMPFLCTFVFLALGAISLWFARCRDACARATEGTVYEYPFKTACILTAGLLVVVASFGFLQELLYCQDDASVSGVIVGTKLAAVAIFVGVLGLTGDVGFALLARLVVTFAAASFLVFLAQREYSFIPSVVMDTGYSLLEMTTLAIAAEFASLVKSSSLRLFAVLYLVESVGYAVGCLMAGDLFGLGEPGLRLEAASLALGLIICGIWAFTEKHVNELLWSRSAEKAPAEGASKSENIELSENGCICGRGETPSLEGLYRRKISIAADRYRLSPREVEVLELFAAGRSAAFIAELQFVTTNTVRSHIKHIYAKCGVHSRQELISLIERQTADGLDDA